jgi:hypothetical protein
MFKSKICAQNVGCGFPKSLFCRQKLASSSKNESQLHRPGFVSSSSFFHGSTPRFDRPIEQSLSNFPRMMPFVNGLTDFPRHLSLHIGNAGLSDGGVSSGNRRVKNCRAHNR